MGKNNEQVIKKIAFYFMMLILAILLVSAFFIGKKYSSLSNNKLLENYHDYCYLGFQAEKSNFNISDISKSYDFDIREIFDSILFDIPKVPTPFVGSAPSPGKYYNTIINKQQFRHKKEIKPKTQSEFRIFIVGGSVAFVAGAPHDSLTIPYLIEKEIKNKKGASKNVKVINAACPAWTTTQEHIWIAKKIIALKPDLIIEYSGRNDAFFNIEYGWDTHLHRTFWDHLFNLIIKNSYSNSNFRTFNDNIIPNNTSTEKTILNFKQNISLNIFLAEQYNFDYCFILQPSLSADKKVKTKFENYIYNKKIESNYHKKLNDYYKLFHVFLKSKKDKTNFFYFDFRNSFKSYKEQIYIDGCHFGDKGNIITAKQICDSLSPYLTKKIYN